jgi:putative salt-induced outer membrane protein YdiY
VKPDFISASIIVSVLLFSAIAEAQEEFIVMQNGDRITGEIKQIWDGELTIEPAYADEFAVDVGDIVQIESSRAFEIELADGSEVTVIPSGVDDSGNQRLVYEDGRTVTLAIGQIMELNEIDDYFDWDSRIDANSVVNRGNTTSETVRINANTNLKIGDHRHIGDLTLADESVNGEPTKKQDLLAYNYNWLFRDAVFFGANASYERDPIRSLERRTIVGAGMGYDFWDDARRTLSMQGGFGYKTENIDASSEQNSIAFWALRFSYDFRGGDLNLFHNHRIDTTLNGRRNSVVKTSTGVRFEITDLMYANLQFVYDYETNPASAAQKQDTSVLAGIGLEF